MEALVDRAAFSTKAAQSDPHSATASRFAPSARAAAFDGWSMAFADGCIRWILLLSTLGAACGADLASSTSPGVGLAQPPAGPTGVVDAGALVPPPVLPATLSFQRDGQTVFFLGEQIEASCVGGHRGVAGHKAGERFGFNAFVHQPGVYHCGDPAPFIFFWHESAVQPGSYGISAVEPAGACTLRVTSLRPRFTATFEATLTRQQGGGPDTLALAAGRFDVPFETATGQCP